VTDPVEGSRLAVLAGFDGPGESNLVILVGLTVSTRGYGKGGGSTFGWIPLLACGAGTTVWMYPPLIGR
jgi:hypothetical protein